MGWWRFWQKDEPAREPAPSRPPETRRPRRSGGAEVVDPAAREKLDRLRRRRDLVRFDVERAEAAHLADNPWQERIDLLTESLATVEADLAAVDQQSTQPGLPLPPTPIEGVEATVGDPAAVRFVIGGERFLFEEETDWDQRGGPVVRGDLRQRSGDAARLVPTAIPPDQREALARHLRDSVVVFATDLRDRALEGEGLPKRPTLAELAQPCPECGGWRDWRGTCERCAERAFRRQHLRAEAERLTKERDQEVEERRRWAERLPVARRRLSDVEAEIEALLGPAADR